MERTQIRDESVDPGPDNPLGDRWIGWSAKGFGFHSTTAPSTNGNAASHGCVRRYPEGARRMFDLVKKGEEPRRLSASARRYKVERHAYTPGETGIPQSQQG